MFETELNEDEFLGRYLPLADRVAERYGFAVPRRPAVQLDATERTYLVRNRRLRATAALHELQQWLSDGDAGVRAAARDSIHRCLNVAYVGDRPDSPDGLLWRRLTRLDAMVGRVLNRAVNDDAAEPRWRTQTGLRAIRVRVIALVLTFSTITAFLLGRFHPALALLTVTGAALCDGLEGSFARVMRMTDSRVRWLSCVTSHVADLIVLGGIFWSELARGATWSADLVLVAGIGSLLGSFVRVSALQAGFRFWRSLLERVFRFSAFYLYCVAASFGYHLAGAVILASILLTFGVAEAVRVIRSVSRLDATRGGLIFLTDETATCLSFDDEGSVDDPAPRRRESTTVGAQPAK